MRKTDALPILIKKDDHSTFIKFNEFPKLFEIHQFWDFEIMNEGGIPLARLKLVPFSSVYKWNRVKASHNFTYSFRANYKLKMFNKNVYHHYLKN